MLNHTPGPWRYSGLSNIYAYYDHYLLHSRLVACVPGAELDGGDKERQANARLIAAAPELLAALKDAVDLADNLYGQLTSEESNLIDVWLAVIAKAEGKS